MHVQRIPFHRSAILCIGAAALAACSPPAPGPQSMRTPDHDIVAAIRAAGNSDSSVVQIAPLRDPAIDGFLDAAHAAERAGDITTAISKADSARGRAPEAPHNQP